MRDVDDDGPGEGFITAMLWGTEPARSSYAFATPLHGFNRAPIFRLRSGNEQRFERVRVLGRLLDRAP